MIRVFSCLVVFCLSSSFAAEVIQFGGYEKAVELKNDSVRVVLCPQVGGRVLEYSLNGKNVLYLSDADRNWKPGQRPQSSAGRFDIGPELTIPRHAVLWSGEWTFEMTGDLSVRLKSQRDDSTGVQLIRDFNLDSRSSHLACRQTIVNVSERVCEYCHWSRTFTVGKGICVIPLTANDDGPASRFPQKYVMYESRGLLNFYDKDEHIREREGTLEIHPTPRHPKLGFDSYAGEMSYLAPNDLLFVKRFKTFPDRVYNEAAGLTISVWYPDREMVELEPIGPRERLQPGDKAEFTEHWYLRNFEFPEGGQVDHQLLQRTLSTLQ